MTWQQNAHRSLLSSQTSSHLDTELLSAYIDREVDLIAARAVEAHVADCPSCHRRLSQLRRVSISLSQLDSVAPPPWLAQRVRAAVATPPPSFWQRLSRVLLQVPLQSPVGSTLSAAVALAVVLYLGTLGAYRGERQNLLWLAGWPGPVSVPIDDPYWHLTPTTSEVAGRLFVLRGDSLRGDQDVWVEQGLRGARPGERIAVSSPEGKKLLARYSDLEYLLADGSRVVMRYRQETLELWSGT